MKAALRWLHRWLGLTLGLAMVVITLSGCWLIYEREIASPGYRLDTQAESLPLQTLLDKAAPMLPSGDILLRMSNKNDRAYQVWGGPEYSTHIVIDQYSGRIIEVRPSDYWPSGWMFEMHSELLNGKPGEKVTGWLAVGFLALTIMGLVLWLPRTWKTLWQMRFGRSLFLTHHDLHAQAGILAVPALLVALITGITLCFSAPTTDFLNRMFDKSTPKIPKVLAGDARLPLDRLVAIANQNMPGGRVSIIAIPGAVDKPVLVRKRMPDDPHTNGLNFIYLDPYTGQIVKNIPIAKADAGRQWFNWAYPLHTGEVLGGWHTWLLFASGLVPAILMVTGLTMYLLRRKIIRPRR